MRTFTVTMDSKIIDCGLLMQEAIDLMDILFSVNEKAKVSCFEEAVNI